MISIRLSLSIRYWKNILLAGVLLLLLVAAAVAWFGPEILRDQAKSWVRTETGRSLEIGKVSINLLALNVEIQNVTLTEADQATPFLSWKRLYVAFSPRSLWHRAPVIRRIQVEQPFVRIERLPEGHFNFSDLLARSAKESEKSAEDDEPAQYSLNNVEVHSGRIEFIDRTLSKPMTHQVEDLDLAVPFVGNLPYLEDRYVQPLLRATVNHTPFELKGELKPFADTQEYSFKLKVDGINLPYYFGYLPDTVPVTVNKGKLDVDLDLTYRTSASAKPVLQLAGRLDLITFDLRERSGRPLLFLPLLETRLAPSYPLDRKIDLEMATFHRPQVWLDRNSAGEWNVSRLGGTAKSDHAVPKQDGKQEGPLQLTINQLLLKDGLLDLRDNLPAGGFITAFKSVNLDVHGFTMAKDTPFTAALTLTSERQEQLAVNGQITVSPFALDLAVDAKGAPLAAYQPYYQEQVAAAIVGSLDFRSCVQIAPEQALRLSDIRLEVHDLDLPIAEEEGFKLADAVLQGGLFDLTANRFEATELALNQADFRFSRGKDGQWSFHDRNYPILAKLAEPTTTPKSTTDKPFSWRFDQISLSDAKLAFRDELPAEPAKFTVASLDVTVSNLAAPDKVPATFAVQGNFQKKGKFQLDGTVVPTGPELTATMQLRRIPLTDFAPYIGEHVRLLVIDGLLDTNLTASVTKQGGAWQGRFGGSLGVNRFYCLDADYREDLLRWERLQVNGIDGRIDPFSLKIASIALNDYYVRLLLDEKAQLNFAQLSIRQLAQGEPPPETGASPKPPAPAKMSGSRPDLRIGKITLQGGKVNFTDRHLVKAFSAEMLELGGRIEGLSSAPETLAEVDLRGHLRNESPLTISGTLNPLADPLSLDLKLSFNDIELSPFSPYSGTYVGYLIERGKLNVTLAYLVENGRLKASNQLFLDQFTFGEKVESDKATSLPVRLAVTLLKDRKGEIHLDIPVYGDLNDPRFSVWGIVWQVIKNLLVKAATSPLALLGALSGGAEDFSAIVFPTGSANLTETEQAKLVKIADALRDRPELKIEVKGYVDPDNDPEGYRRELLQEKIRRERLFDLRKQQGETAPTDAAKIVVTASEYPDYLWRVYKSADFPKPRNLVGLVKHLPDEELEKLLLANTKIGNEELTSLAQLRAATVVTALTEPGRIPRDRIFLGTSDIAAMPAGEGLSRSRVEFGMAVK